ncbi:DUF5946 family protein [Nocardioides iriomotensis]|uniref:Uncharacterized protein n=1 Tax=Nocardioides iriomotensis TaxID=715784 RepID=A0A4V1Z2I4_9ACTN|nr:DUF5946 family protein [Nocardioides iriomotensis]RYU14516.1 hypothetical protein ETU37_03020 [Nocardioides iriomotensis]
MADAACPGCGLALPATPGAPAREGYRSSPECAALLGEVVAFGMAHPVELARWHQTTTDAYLLQHVSADTKPIAMCFALNTLYLVLERGWTGLEGRAAHGHLANTVPRDEWLRFDVPASVGDVTVLEPALASSPEEQAAAVERWGRSVWAAWSHVHDDVRAMTDRQLGGWRP